MELLLFIIGMLATWRASYLLQNEPGPAGIFLRLQAWMAKHEKRPGDIGDGFYCFYCLSMWIALPIAAVISNGDWWLTPIYWFALSAGAIFINTWHEKQ